MKSNLWSSAATNGFLLALVTIIFTLFQAAFPMEGIAVNALLSLVKLVATIGLLFYFMRAFGQTQEDSYTYSQAFSYGFLVSFCSNIVIACYFWIHHTMIFPDLLEKSLSNMEKLYAQYNVDQAAIDIVIKYWPVISSVGPFILYSLLALIFAAILALFAKKPDIPFPNEAQD